MTMTIHSKSSNISEELHGFFRFSRICLLYFDPSLARFTESSEESDLGLGSQLSGKIEDFLMMKGCLHPIFSNLRLKNVEKCCPSEAAWGHVSSFVRSKCCDIKSFTIFLAQWQSIKRTWPKKNHQKSPRQMPGNDKNHHQKSSSKNQPPVTKHPLILLEKTHLRMGDFSFRNPRPSDRKELSRRGRPSVRGVPAIVHKVLSTYAEWDVSVCIYIYIYIYITS